MVVIVDCVVKVDVECDAFVVVVVVVVWVVASVVVVQVVLRRCVL